MTRNRLLRFAVNYLRENLYKPDTFLHQWCPLYRDSTVEKKESVFSHVYRTLTPQSGSLQMNRILSRFLTFQQNRQEKQTCCQHNTFKDVIEKAKKVRWEFNKQHHSPRDIFNKLFLEKQYMICTFIFEIHLFCS